MVFEQQQYEVRAARPDSVVKRRGAQAVAGIYIGAAGDAGPDSLRVAGPDCFMQIDQQDAK
jgi:hypothetical protein